MSGLIRISCQWWLRGHRVHANHAGAVVPPLVCMQDLAATQLRCSRLSDLLHSAEAARQAADAHARKLEAKFEKSGRGVALLKAAHLSTELEAAQAELRRMHTVVADRVSAAC